jgi:hypothetical protein
VNTSTAAAAAAAAAAVGHSHSLAQQVLAELVALRALPGGIAPLLTRHLWVAQGACKTTQQARETRPELASLHAASRASAGVPRPGICSG